MPALPLFALLLFFAADAPKAPTPRESLSFHAPAAPTLSPDGQWVAYLSSETDWEANEFRSQLWLVRADGTGRVQLTRGKKGVSSPQWSPDGRWLSFLRDRDGKTQLWLMSPAGGEAWALTKDEAGVQGYDWAPNSKALAYTSNGPESKARKERKETYGDFTVVDHDLSYSHLYTVELPAEPGAAVEAKPLTNGESFSVSQFRWSPDSTRIAFSGPTIPDLSHQDTSDIYVVTVADKSVKKLVSTEGPDDGPVWSPGGNLIAYTTANANPHHYYTNIRLAVVPSTGGTPRILAADFDEQPNLLDWSEAGIWFAAFQKTNSWLFLYDFNSNSWRRAAGDERLSFNGCSFDRDFRRMACTAVAPNDFAEIVTGPVDGKSLRPVTDFRAQYKDLPLATRELVRWKSRDGAEIEGVLLKPADYQPGRRYPLLVVIHGGPTGIDRPIRNSDRTYPLEQFCARGAIILRPNYRGSAGYGERFRSLNVRNLGVGDAWDVLSGVDYLIDQGLADPNRLGAMGWSQGGYISAYLTTTSQRFKAISVGAGISDWMTYYVNTDIHPFTRQYLEATPWDDPAIYAKTSPISFIKQARTPTLIQHGENDHRVPLPNAYELYQGLLDQGVAARLVVYAGFGHGISKPKQNLHVMEDNLEWFTKYVLGGAGK